MRKNTRNTDTLHAPLPVGTRIIRRGRRQGEVEHRIVRVVTDGSALQRGCAHPVEAYVLEDGTRVEHCDLLAHWKITSVPVVEVPDFCAARQARVNAAYSRAVADMEAYLAQVYPMGRRVRVNGLRGFACQTSHTSGVYVMPIPGSGGHEILRGWYPLDSVEAE